MLKQFKSENMDEKNRRDFIKSLKKKYSFIEHEIVGQSLCHRNIDCLKIGKSKNSVLFVGATHGMEWITSSLLFYFLEDICNAISKDKKIIGVKLKSFFEYSSLVVVPCLNPDGVEIQMYGSKAARKYSDLISKINKDTNIWQANARGVDLNHNFDAGWQEVHELEKRAKITGPAPTRYGGKAPFTEPESKTILKICEDMYFRHVLAFHSQGKEIFWDYGENTPSTGKTMAHLMYAGSGYKVSKPEGLAVGGGLKDWFIEKFKRPGFTIEVGTGKNPLPITDLPEIYKDLFETMVLMTLV